jgi:paired amphipathic helix protein Sin3a
MPDFLDRVRVKPVEIINAFMEEIKAHRNRHIKFKQEQEKVWREICEKNYTKSLDYRAFYFRQTEKKCIGTKSFVNEIKARFDKWNLPTTPALVKKGGTVTSVYYNSFAILPPEHFHTSAIEGDEIAMMSTEDVKKYGPKLPQLQLRFDRPKVLTDTYKIILESILMSINSQSEKDRQRGMLDKLMVEFFKFDVKKVVPDTSEPFTEHEIKVLTSDGFFNTRIEQVDLPFDRIWQETQDNMQDINSDERTHDLKKIKGCRTSKNARGHSKKVDKSAVRGLDIVDRGLAKSEHKGPEMHFHMENRVDKDNARFLPSLVGVNTVMYGTQEFYSFFRHFHCLYERLIKARVLAKKGVEEELEKRKNLQLANKRIEILGKSQYEEVYLRCLKSLLHGSIDTAKYEDSCRHCLGEQAYLMFSIDKLIHTVLLLCNINRLLN